MTTRPPLRDRLYAQGAAWATRHPLVRGVLEGGDISPVTPIGFHVARTVADELPDLAVFPGDEVMRYRTRRSWPVGVMAVRSEVFNRALSLPENAGGKRAVAWVLGRSVLVGAIPLAHEKLWEEENPTIGMRIGPDTLSAAPVVLRRDNTVAIPQDSFEVASPLPAYSEYLSYYDNPHDAHAAGVLVY